MYSVDIFNIPLTEVKTFVKTGVLDSTYSVKAHMCFDAYQVKQFFGVKLVSGFPSEKFLDEFIQKLKDISKVKPKKLPRSILDRYFEGCSCGYYFLYPREFSRKQIFVLDYLLHQFLRIPSIIEVDFKEAWEELKISSYQKALDAVGVLDAYWGFHMRFNYEDVLKRLHKAPEKPLAKQTEIVKDILSPFAWTIDGERFIIDPTDLDTVLLAYRYDKKFYIQKTSAYPVEQSELPENLVVRVFPIEE